MKKIRFTKDEVALIMDGLSRLRRGKLQGRALALDDRAPVLVESFDVDIRAIEALETKVMQAEE